MAIHCNNYKFVEFVFETSVMSILVQMHKQKLAFQSLWLFCDIFLTEI